MSLAGWSVQYASAAGSSWPMTARPESENSILAAVRGFSCRARGLELVVLGRYSDEQWYHRAIQDAASDAVMFLGAVYDARIVQSLRCHGIAYVHGHQVGGTNPSRVEALGAGNAVTEYERLFDRFSPAATAAAARAAEAQ